jgi:KaiC/GvpD/RAD55 family RecA-like ATPase
MAPKGSSLADIQEVPERSLILLAGAPSAGKATFSHQVVLHSVAADRPIIFVTTERSAPDVISLLKEQGLGDPTPELVNLVDAFRDTVGAHNAHRPETMRANSMDLNSLTIALTKVQKSTEQKGTSLVLDSPTTPYLFNGAEVRSSGPLQGGHDHGQRDGKDKRELQGFIDCALHDYRTAVMLLHYRLLERSSCEQ